MPLTHIDIWTDGSCKKGGNGGWAALLQAKSGRKTILERLISGHQTNTTNNAMELKAILEAFKSIKKKQPLNIYSDSEYCVKVLSPRGYADGWVKYGWKTRNGEAVKNMELINEILWHRNNFHVEFIHVPAHRGIPENERVDLEAQRQADLMKAGPV
jgi:ribonuclease HI